MVIPAAAASCATAPMVTESAGIPDLPSIPFIRPRSASACTKYGSPSLTIPMPASVPSCASQPMFNPAGVAKVLSV